MPKPPPDEPAIDQSLHPAADRRNHRPDRRVNVNRVLADLERQGLIERKGREIEFSDLVGNAPRRSFQPEPSSNKRFGEAWWARQGLNLRPHPCEGCALPLSYAPTPRQRKARAYRGAMRLSSAAVQDGCIELLTASLSPLPARNLGWAIALICIGSPVRGLRPVEALRREQREIAETDQPHLVAALQGAADHSNIVSTARDASLRLRPARRRPGRSVPACSSVPNSLLTRLASTEPASGD